ncbi:hypothetical protein [Gordonia sp. NPDC058843]|uniref:hypothetical protein n=1 Tax=Gordonia sp. NPDC058843 TaxID=3346648 RepID=UPI0036A1DE8B
MNPGWVHGTITPLYRLTEQERGEIRSPAAWLTRAASRIALDVLSSARARREKQIGQWLPELIPSDLFRGTGTASDAAVGVVEVVSVAPNVVTGTDRVARFLMSVMQTADGLGYALTLGGRLFGIARFHVEGEQITDVWLVLDPRKLGEWVTPPIRSPSEPHVHRACAVKYMRASSRSRCGRFLLR